MATPNTQAVPLQRGIVKQIVSGDSIIIRGQPKGGPPPEKQINLTFVTAPKVSKRLPPNADNPKRTQTNEEPWGWATREYLRKRLIGKEIAFRTEYSVPFGQSKRECGIVFVGDENIVETLVSEGYVDVNKRKQNSENPEVIHLTELEEAAQQAGKGKHGDGQSTRQVTYEVDNPNELINKTYNAIVEHVINGSTIRVALETGPNAYHIITVMISGIRSPNASEPFGNEAKFFVESRLLQKDVQVRIEGVVPGANPAFHGSVTLNQHNIAEHLVREGMAKCMDRTILQTMSPERLRLAEADAKSKTLRIWKDYKVAVRSDAQSFDAKVLEVINGDALRVENLKTKEEKKIFLASVRPPPRPENAQVSRVLYDVPFMFEAREFLRKRLIHKQVKVRVDYEQPSKDNYPEKVCCTVLTSEGINVAEALIARGLATTVRYRPDDESRSSAYDQLLAAEQKAKLGGKGLHGNAANGQTRVVELSNDAAKAKSFLPFLLGRGSQAARRDAVVEYVLSASKLRLYIPKENCCLAVILVGISTPRGNEPYSEESKQWVNSQIFQRDVQVTVEALDKAGNFIGTVYFDDKNLTVELLKNGYASIRDERGADYKRAEDDAKAARLKIWENFKEEEPKPVEEENGDAEEETTKQNGDSTKPAKDDRKKIVVTQIGEGATTIAAQFVDVGPALEELLVELREELANNPPLPGAFSPTRGDIVAAKFSADGEWYRAKVDKVAPGQVQVTYIDYGNKETVKTRDVAPLPSSKFNTSSFPAAAKEYALAFVNLPEDPELVEESKNALTQDTLDRVLLLRSEYKDASTGAEHVTLFDPESNKDLVLELVTEGLYLMNLKERRKERRLQKTVTEYRTAQDAAKKARRNLWRYGDFTEDDAKEFGYKAAA